MRVLIQLIEELHTWGAAALMIFPARRRLRRVQAENDELRQAAYLASGCAEATLAACDRLTKTP